MRENNSRTDDLFNRARIAMAQGEIAQARKLVMPLTKPANEREVRGAAYSILGRCAYVKTRYFNTIRLLKKARSLGDASVETFLTLGLAYEASATKARWFRVKGNLELANQTFKLARASHADNELISIANANIAFQQHKWLRAIKILEPHVADSKNPLLFTIYSESLRRAGQVEEANSFLLRSCSQEITADVLLAIVMRYHNNGEFPAAHSVLKVCSDRFPESVESELFVALDTTVCLGDMLFNFLPEFRKKAEQRSATITELENHVVETRSLRQLNGLYKEITRYVTNEMAAINERIDKLRAAHIERMMALPIPSDTTDSVLQDPSIEEQNLIALKKFGESLPILGAMSTFRVMEELNSTAKTLRYQFARKFLLWRMRAYSTAAGLWLLQLISGLGFLDSLVGVFVSGGIVVKYFQGLFTPFFQPLVAVVSGLLWLFFVILCGAVRKRILTNTVRDLSEALAELVTGYGRILVAADMDATQFEAALPVPVPTQSVEELINYALDPYRLPDFRCHAFYHLFETADAKEIQSCSDKFIKALEQPPSHMRLIEYFGLFVIAMGHDLDVETFIKRYIDGGQWSDQQRSALRLSVIALPEEDQEKEARMWRLSALRALRLRGKPDGIGVIERLWDDEIHSMKNMNLADTLKNWPTDDGVLALIDLAITNDPEGHGDVNLLEGANLSEKAIAKLSALASDDERFELGRSDIVHLLLGHSNPLASASGRKLLRTLSSLYLHSLAKRLVINHQEELLSELAMDTELGVSRTISLATVLADEKRGDCEELLMAIADEDSVPADLEYLTKLRYFEALGSVGSANTLKLLTDYLNDSDKSTRQLAQRGLARAGERGSLELGTFLNKNPNLPKDVEIELRLAHLVLRQNGTRDWELLLKALRKDHKTGIFIVHQLCELAEQAAFHNEESVVPNHLFDFLEKLESEPEFADMCYRIRQERERTSEQIKLTATLRKQKALRIH